MGLRRFFREVGERGKTTMIANDYQYLKRTTNSTKLSSRLNEFFYLSIYT